MSAKIVYEQYMEEEEQQYKHSAFQFSPVEINLKLYVLMAFTFFFNRQVLNPRTRLWYIITKLKPRSRRSQKKTDYNKTSGL